MRGILWLIVGFLAICLLVLISLLEKEPEWCTGELDAGDCKMHEDRKCYCIDTIDAQSGVYELAAKQCRNLNGSIAVPDNSQLLIWLSKRVYFMGLDNAFIGLRKIESRWFWMHLKLYVATHIQWRSQFQSTPADFYANLNVESIEKQAQGEFQEYDDYLYYYNYDFYIEKDKSYSWYGFVTSNNTKNNIKGSYYICSYASPPKIAKPQATTAATTIDQDVDEDAFGEKCWCSSNAHMQLLDLNATVVFNSPNFPSNYCSDLNCRWIIETKSDLAIELDWLVFHLEKDMDFVYIYDGHSTDSPLLSSCTSNICGDTLSSSNFLHIHFNSDHVVTSLGFKAQVTAVHRDACYCPELTVISLTNIYDSYTLLSPNYPMPYCQDFNCKWLFIAATSYGIQLTWNIFDIELDRDFVIVTSGNDTKMCTGTVCTRAISASNQVQVQFRTDNQSSENLGFSAQVVAVRNHCTKSSLHAAIGSNLTYSATAGENVRVRGSATLVCPQNYKIANSLNERKDTVVCESPFWNRQLNACVPACAINFTTAPSLEKVNICDFGQMMETELVSLHQSIVFEQYNLVTNTRLAGPYAFHCTDSGWARSCPGNQLCYDWPETCHVIEHGILFVGGLSSDDLSTTGTTLNTTEFYRPLGDRSGQVLELELIDARSVHVTVLLPDKRVLVAGGYNSGVASMFMGYKDPDAGFKSSEIINLNTKQVVQAGDMIYERFNSAAAVLDGEVWVCGGENIYRGEESTCETFDLASGTWNIGRSMTVARSDLRLVATQQNLYAIGGFRNLNQFTFRDCHKSVEKYSKQRNRWTRVSSMSTQRNSFAAVHLEGVIYVCGGENDMCGDFLVKPRFLDSCERYLIEADRWEAVARMQTDMKQFDLVAFKGRLFACCDDQFNVGVYDPETDRWDVDGYIQQKRQRASAVTAAIVKLSDDDNFLITT